jgi:DNA-directed RNA polymerase subunit RPC12/RpoP
MTVLTADQYARQHGLQCPYCRSEAITPTGHMESDGGIAWREIACKECGGSWTESYGLVGYAGLKTNFFLKQHQDG